MLSLSRAKAKEKLEQEQREREQKAKEEEKRVKQLQSYTYKMELDELDELDGWGVSSNRSSRSNSRSSRKKMRQAKRNEEKKKDKKSKRWNDADFGEADFFNGSDSTTSSDGDGDVNFDGMSDATDMANGDNAAWEASTEPVVAAADPWSHRVMPDRLKSNQNRDQTRARDGEAEEVLKNLGLEESKLSLLCNEYTFGRNESATVTTTTTDSTDGSNSRESNESSESKVQHIGTRNSDCESKAQPVVFAVDTGPTKHREGKRQLKYEPPSFEQCPGQFQYVGQFDDWKAKSRVAPVEAVKVESVKFETAKSANVPPVSAPIVSTVSGVPKNDPKDPYAEIEKRILYIDLLSSLPEGCPGNYSKYNAKARGVDIVQFYHDDKAALADAKATNAASGGWIKLNACPLKLIERIILLTPISTRTDICATIALQTKNYQHHVFETANNAKHFVRRITLLLATTDFQ